ncbi:hypothetical protein BD769DRAFT_1388567, partial [Suillus cothurnatus]
MADIDNVAQTKQEMDEDDEWEGEGATRPPAPSNVKATSPSGTYACNQLINAKQGQNGTEWMVRLDIEEDKNEENTEIAQHRKRKQRVVYSASTDDERSTSKKLKHDECFSQPIGRVEVLLPNWRTIVARLEPVQANNIDYGGYEIEDEAVEEDEEEKSNIVGRNGSQHAPSEISQ